MSLSNWQFVARPLFVANLKYIDGSNLLLDSKLPDSKLPEPVTQLHMALYLLAVRALCSQIHLALWVWLYTQSKNPVSSHQSLYVVVCFKNIGEGCLFLLLVIFEYS